MYITTSIEPRHRIKIRNSGRGNIRLDVASFADPEHVVSMPLGQLPLDRNFSHISATTDVILAVRDTKGKVLAKRENELHVRMTAAERELLRDLIGEVRGLAAVASRR